MAEKTLKLVITGDEKDARNALSRLRSDADATQGRFSKFGAGVAKVGAVAASGLAVVGGAAIAAGVKGVTAFADLERGMNEVFTLMPGISESAMGEMTDQVRDFSKEFGTLPEEVVPSLYQAISAGVPRDNVFEFLETAQKAAIGGVTNLETAVDGISSVVNAYGDDVINAAEASDLMFTAVRLGKTNFEELSSSLFNVTPTASALGVKFGDVTAALAAMTAQGTPTSVATTQLRQLFVELSKEGSKAAKILEEETGQSFAGLVAEGASLEDILGSMQKAAEKNDVALQDMFGSVEAGSAALSLAGSEAFSDALDEMGSSAGATEAAFGQMDQGLSRTWDKIKATFSDAFLEIGERLAPFAATFSEWFAEKMPGIIDTAVTAFSNIVAWWEANGPAIIATVQTVFSAVSTAISTVIEVIQTIIGWFQSSADESNSAFSKIRAFAEETWPKIQEIITGVMEVIRTVIQKVTDIIGAVWEQHGERIMAIVAVVWDNVKTVINTVLGVIKGIIDTVMGILTGDWDRAWNGIKGIVSSVWDGIRRILDNAATFIRNVIPIALDALQEAFEFVWDTVKGIVSSAWDDVKSFVTGGIDSVVGFIGEMPGKIRSAAAGMWDGIKDAFRAAVNWIIRKWNGLTLKIGGQRVNLPFGLSFTIPSITLRTPNIPTLHTGGVFRAPTPGGEGLALLRDRERVTPPGLHEPQVIQLNLDGRVLMEWIIEYEAALA